jgi:thiamine-monophosphate kinase
VTLNRAVGEFELIERIRRRVAGDASVPVGIGDDAAVIRTRPGMALVATTDSLVLDRHFTTDWPPAAIGHLAAHANLSDLAAMGAVPRWALLALTLPEDDAAWLEGFLDGFLAAADSSGLVLVGGNISSGPLNITVELLGEVNPDHVATRRGAQSGDLLVVTGTLGDAAAALALGNGAPEALMQRLRRPEARIQAGQVLARSAHAVIDISDGLLADLGHLLNHELGAEIRLADLPSSAALNAAVSDKSARWRFQAGGGNDYELLAALPAQSSAALEELTEAAGVALTVIGRLDNGNRVRCLDDKGVEIADLEPGWDHFSS